MLYPFHPIISREPDNYRNCAQTRSTSRDFISSRCYPHPVVPRFSILAHYRRDGVALPKVLNNRDTFTTDNRSRDPPENFLALSFHSSSFRVISAFQARNFRHGS